MMPRPKNAVNVHLVIAVVSRGTVTPITTAVTGTFGTYRAAVIGDLVTIGTVVGRHHPARALGALIARATGVKVHLGGAIVLAAKVHIHERTILRDIPVRLGAADARTAMVHVTLILAPRHVTT